MSRNGKLLRVSGLEAARRLEVDENSVYKWLKEDRIAAVRQGGRWVVFLLEVDGLGEKMYFTLSPQRLTELLGENVPALVG